MNACEGKTRYRNRRAAKTVASYLRRTGKGALHPYLCPEGAHWHIGHAPGEGTGLRRGLSPTGFVTYIACPTCTTREGHKVMSLRQGGSCARCGYSSAVRSRL